MRIIVITGKNLSFVSKSETMTLAEVAEVAEGMYESIGKLDKLQFATDDGYVIFSEDVLKSATIKVLIEDCDRNNPDNPK